MLSATIIPSVAVPLSLVGTFGVMYLLGYSLDNLSLMALTISTGFVVDDAIVMIENIIALHRGGRVAAGGGAQGLGADRLHHPVADRLADRRADPAALHGRLVGRLFREFAVTLSVTILISAVVSLTLTPMMCARLCSTSRESQQGRFYRASEGSSTRDHRGLRRAPCGGCSGHQPPPCWWRSAPWCSPCSSTSSIPKGFFPGAGHRRDPGHLRGAAVDLVPSDGRAAAGAGAGHPEGPRGREPVVLHRRRRHQHHPEQRPHPDQSEAARRAEDQRAAT